MISNEEKYLKAILESNIFIARKLCKTMKEERELDNIGEGLIE